jgi:hypothetical protein
VQVLCCCWRKSKALDEAPYKLSGAVTKLAGITFLSLAFSYWIDKLWFLTEGKLVAVLITPSLGVPNWSVIYIITTTPSKIFWRRCQGKRRLLQGEFRTHILYFVLSFADFVFTCIVFIKNTQNLVSFIIVYYV